MKKIIITIIVLAVITGVGYFIYKFIYQKSFFGFNQISIEYDASCVTDKIEDFVRGDSLQGVINNGETVEILTGYYDCNEIKRNDVVAYDFSGNTDPIIKIIKALPGDIFSLKLNEDGGYNIIVNNEVLTISTGLPYELSEAKSKMLTLYVNDYKGVMPTDSYLILGNQSAGTLDSTKFGLINKDGIIGKVIKK